MAKTRCDDCRNECDQAELIWPIPDIHERIEPGCVVPAGECRQCGALSYLTEPI